MTKEVLQKQLDKEVKQVTNFDVGEYLKTKESRTYSRSLYDQFLKAVNFSYKSKSVHITGTNGKGSVVAFLTNIYLEAGYKVGSFTSPSFENVNEQILINNRPITDEELSRYVLKYKDLFEEYHLTQFEIITFICFNYFDDNNIDLGLIEVGMGGLVDATNVFTPILSVITNVTLDHQQYLGTNIEQIAAHKAGIIKKDVPLVYGNIRRDALEVIKAKAEENNATILSSNYEFTNLTTTLMGLHFYNKEEELEIAIPAIYELENVKVVLSVTDYLNKYFPISRDHIKHGLAKTKINGRFNVVSNNPIIIIDGAHNIDGTKVLINSVLALRLNKQINVVFAAFKDKDVEQELDLYGLVGARITLTTWEHNRARTKEDYHSSERFIKDPIKAITECINNYNNEIILITGSLNFAYYVSDLFKRGNIRI